MQADYIIVGGGLCGTLLSWFLNKEGKTAIVIDEGTGSSASKVAAGIINPVTGRRYVASWMIEELIPFVKQAYGDLETYLETKLLVQTGIIDFFPSPQMRDAFVNRVTENDTYLHSYPDQNDFNPYFNYDFGCGAIRPVFMVQVQLLLQAWQQQLKQKSLLLAERFNAAQLTHTKQGVAYNGITAEKIIFCEGSDALQNPWFGLLPFSAVKGEALIIETETLPIHHIYKKGFMLAPLPQAHQFWVGSNYQWEFATNAPTPQFLEHTMLHLKQWLKMPFKVLDHKAAIRPATIERRPFVGLHPVHSNIGILNGMGTKGTSLAPYFAHQLAQHLVYGFPIMNEANINRFSRILSYS